MVKGVTKIDNDLYKYKIRVQWYGVDIGIKVWYKKKWHVFYNSFNYGIYITRGVAVKTLEELENSKDGLDIEMGKAIQHNIEYVRRCNRWV